MKFLIADDHSLIVKGFINIIKSYFNNVECDSAESYNKLQILLKNNTYDILFLDIRLGKDDARVFSKNIIQQYPKMPIIIISSLDDNNSISILLGQGVKAYILKTDEEEEIIKAINTVLEGKIFLSKNLQQTFLERNLSINKNQEIILSDREKEVLELIVNEFSTKEIAKKLFLSPKTIESYRSNLFLKFDVKNVAGLVRKAISRGYV